MTPPVAPSTRALWVRPTLFVLFVLALPFTWTEETYPSCDGSTARHHEQTGFELLFHGGAGGVILSLLFIAVVVLGLTAHRARPGVRIAAQLTALLASALGTWFAVFLTTFTFMVQLRVRMAAWFGLSALGGMSVDALVRTVAEIAAWARSRARSPRA